MYYLAEASSKGGNFFPLIEMIGSLIVTGKQLNKDLRNNPVGS